MRRAKDWPGASSLPWLVLGKPIRGVWTSFTARYHATHPKKRVPKPGEFDTVYELKLAALPCWKRMSAELWRRLVAEMVEEIEAEASDDRVALHVEVLGVEAVLAADPRSRIPRQRRTRAPSVHAVDKAVRAMLKERLRLRSEVDDEASLRFRDGVWPFPLGCFGRTAGSWRSWLEAAAGGGAEVR